MKRPTDVELNKRLIKVLEEEKNLALESQADMKTPYIKKGFFQEIFDNKRLSLKAAEISNSTDEENAGATTEHGEVSDGDEDKYFVQQRRVTKIGEDPMKLVDMRSKSKTYFPILRA